MRAIVIAKSFKVAVLGLVAVGMTGCATVRSPVIGLLYTDVRGPVHATDAYGGNGRGEACASSILGLVATGDASIDAAKKDGGIAQVVAVDNYSNSILGIIAKYCTVVYGKKGGAKSAPKPAPTPAAAEEEG